MNNKRLVIMQTGIVDLSAVFMFLKIFLKTY